MTFGRRRRRIIAESLLIFGMWGSAWCLVAFPGPRVVKGASVSDGALDFVRLVALVAALALSACLFNVVAVLRDRRPAVDVDDDLIVVRRSWRRDVEVRPDEVVDVRVHRSSTRSAGSAPSGTIQRINLRVADRNLPIDPTDDDEALVVELRRSINPGPIRGS